MSWNKTHSKALEEKVARLKNANHRIREELKQCYKKIAELEEAMKPKTCYGCVYEEKDGVLHVECAFCLRNSNDNFKPKDTQC